MLAVANNRLSLYTKPPPETDMNFAFSHVFDVEAGALLLITLTREGVYDPYVGQSDWNAQVCRALSVTKDLGGFAVRARVQILPAIDGGKIAPAFSNGLTGTMTKGTSPNSFLGDATTYVQVRNAFVHSDLSEFVAGDLLELRDVNGALKEGTFTIESFGSNEAATPAAADTDQINVVEAIASTMAAGDYLTFAPWSGSNNSNMNQFAAYGDATDEELGAGDSPKKFA